MFSRGTGRENSIRENVILKGRPFHLWLFLYKVRLGPYRMGYVPRPMDYPDVFLSQMCYAQFFTKSCIDCPNQARRPSQLFLEERKNVNKLKKKHTKKT